MSKSKKLKPKKKQGKKSWQKWDAARKPKQEAAAKAKEPEPEPEPDEDPFDRMDEEDDDLEDEQE